jgi:hypothetical protein
VTVHNAYPPYAFAHSFPFLDIGPDKGGYYHELFLRGKPTLCRKIERTRIKGKGARKAVDIETEPDFYKMTPLPPDDSAAMGQSPAALPATQSTGTTETIRAQSLPVIEASRPSMDTFTANQDAQQVALLQQLHFWQSLEAQAISQAPALSSTAMLPHVNSSLAVPASAPSHGHAPSNSSYAIVDSRSSYRSNLAPSQSSIAQFATVQSNFLIGDQELPIGNQAWDPSQSALQASSSLSGRHGTTAHGFDPTATQNPSSRTPFSSLSTSAAHQHTSSDPSTSSLRDAVALSSLFEPTPFPQLPSHPPNQLSQQNPNNQLPQGQPIFLGRERPSFSENLADSQLAVHWDQLLPSQHTPGFEELSHLLLANASVNPRMFLNFNTEEGKEGRTYPIEAEPGQRDDQNEEAEFQPD